MISVIVFIVGLIFGSFLNMLIYRLPLQISLINPKRSICTKCEYQLKWYENIPLFSYIFLKGKCSNCKDKISITYPIVEFLTAIVTLFLFLKLGINTNFFVTVLIFYTLITLSFIDFKYKAVPDYLLLLALCFSFFNLNFSFKDALLFAGGFALLEFFVTFYIQNIKARLTKNEDLKTQKSMGDGDIPIVAVIGGLLGIKLGMIAVFLSAIFAIIPSLYLNIKKIDIEIAFIPFLSLGLFFVFVFENRITSLMRGLF